MKNGYKVANMVRLISSTIKKRNMKRLSNLWINSVTFRVEAKDYPKVYQIVESIVKKINDKRIKFFNLSVRKKRYPYLNEYAANHWYVGSSVGANKAIAKSSGDWIARLDDWAIWTDKNLEIMVNNSIKRREIEFFTGSTLYNEKKTMHFWWSVQSWLHSEIYFLDKLWPDFTGKDLKKVLNNFQKVKRNFGSI